MNGEEPAISRSPLDGQWQLTRAELAGEIAPDLVAERTILELRDGTYLVRFADKIVDEGTFEVTLSETQQCLVLRGREGPNSGRRIPSIFQLRGDRLRVCYGLDGATPDAFATDGQTQRYLASYRRR